MSKFLLFCLRQNEFYRRLTREFGFSRETIRNDVEIFRCSHSIETVRSRYEKGLQVRSDYLHTTIKSFNTKEVTLLIKLNTIFNRNDLTTLSWKSLIPPIASAKRSRKTIGSQMEDYGQIKVKSLFLNGFGVASFLSTQGMLS